MLQLLDAGKHVITANKALLADYGPELFEHARQKDCSIAFEASVCGGVPIISTMSQSLSANQIVSLRGILNGTSNYIVTKMAEEGVDYAATVEEAQRLGYAEADPTFDVDGSDAAQKLAILAQLGFGAKVDWADIPKRGIDSIRLVDFSYAQQMGYRIKLIAFAELGPDGLQLSVAPMLVRIGKPLAEVRENYNAVSVVGDAVGPVFLHGQGAGQMPTASAVVADLIDTAVGRTEVTFRASQLWASDRPQVQQARPGNLVGRFYLRFSVDDEPGVLAQIAGVLGEFGISIASVIQHDSAVSSDSGVPVIIMTQPAPEASANDAVAQIRRMPSVRDEFERLRIL